MAPKMANNAIANALNPSYKSSLNIAQMRKDWRKCRMKNKLISYTDVCPVTSVSAVGKS